MNFVSRVWVIVKLTHSDNAAIGQRLRQRSRSFARAFRCSFNGLYINSLLSLKTLPVKATSDLFNGGFIQPLEQVIKGAYMGDRTAAIQGLQQWVGMTRSVLDSVSR